MTFPFGLRRRRSLFQRRRHQLAQAGSEAQEAEDRSSSEMEGHFQGSLQQSLIDLPQLWNNPRHRRAKDRRRNNCQKHCDDQGFFDAESGASRHPARQITTVISAPILTMFTRRLGGPGTSGRCATGDGIASPVFCVHQASTPSWLSLDGADCHGPSMDAASFAARDSCSSLRGG